MRLCFKWKYLVVLTLLFQASATACFILQEGTTLTDKMTADSILVVNIIRSQESGFDLDAGCGSYYIKSEFKVLNTLKGRGDYNGMATLFRT